MTTILDPGMQTVPGPSRKRLPGRLLILPLIGLLAVAGGGFAWHSLSNGENVESLYVVESVRTADIERTVTATGILQPRDYVDVGTQVSGQLKKIHVDIGTEVVAGDLLAEIDPTVYRSRVDASRAQLASLKAQLAEQHARLKLAEQQYARQQALVREDATTLEQVQMAEAELQIGRAQIAALGAQIEQTESTLRGDEANLGYTKIYAPMAGTVVSLTARQGQTLNANQQAPIILRIADLSVMTVQAQVSEADVVRLTRGMQAYFTTLGNADKRWYGTLDRILPTPQVLNSVVLYDALFDVPNPDQALMTNMTAQVFFVVAAAQNAVVVPISALQSSDGGAPSAATSRGAASGWQALAGEPREHHVGDGRATENELWVGVVAANGAIEQRRVRVGVRNRAHVQIVDGLVSGERIVVGRRQAGAAKPGSLRPNPSRPMGL